VHGLERDADRIAGSIEERMTMQHERDAGEPVSQVAAD
jgi:hypothetical protein